MKVETTDSIPTPDGLLVPGEERRSRSRPRVEPLRKGDGNILGIMGYSFEAFYARQDTNWYEDDEMLRRLLVRYAGHPEDRTEAAIRDWGSLCSGTLRELAERSALTENRPFLRRVDAYNERVDEVVLPPSTLRALQIIEGEHHLGAVHGDPQIFYAKWYLYNQNGEAGVGCSLACTDGMVRALEILGDQPIHREVVRQIRESTPDRYTHGAQFVTEIQGGSDAAANVLEARSVAGRWTLHGAKWFCSNINADYFLVTGRPRGARGVALFLVPAYRDEDRRYRNGYLIDRLKEKLGTCELATAEVTFDGARAYPVGALDRGLANVVSHVLVTSRFACTIVAAASLRRAERIATAYADFRTAFGHRLVEYALVQQTLTDLREARERNLAAVVELLRMWRLADASDSDDTPEALDFRYLLSLCKAVFTRDATRLLHEAIMLLGGNGVEERFSALPRLWRDAIIMETWEGPHNVLVTQALRDMIRFEVDPASFVERVAGEPRRDLAQELAVILSSPNGSASTVLFARFAAKLVRAFGERVRHAASIP